MRVVFGGFEIDREDCQLFRAGIEVAIERRVFDLLCYFLDHPKRLISKQELLEHVWHVQTLSDGVLANTLAKLRKALGQPADGREPVETVRGRGYRFHGFERETPVSRLSVPGEARSQDASDPFVGRHYAIEQLTAALERVSGGAGGLFVIAGEAGIGKTRVVTEFEKLASARGFSVWLGTAHDGGVTPAYWPWVELLRSAHEQLSPGAWQRALPASHAALAQLVPELCTHTGGADTSGQTLRFKLFDEVTHFLKVASRDAPRLLVIDDLHSADAATIELLTYAARVLERRPVLFVATVRDRDVVLDEQHHAALRRLDRRATRIGLEGLSSDEVAELTYALEDAVRGDARLVEALCQRTQGNPLFIRQMLGWLRVRGALSDAGVLQSSMADLPPALRGVVQQRIAALDEETRAVLSVAAVAGREFDANLVAESIGHSLEQVVSAIEPALGLRVVEHRHSMPPQGFAFTHSLLCDALYETLGAARRGLVHARLAHALLARGAADDPRRLGEVVQHLLLAVPSELEACVVHCRAAAVAARVNSGFEAAAELLSRLIRKHESEAGDLHVRCELLLTLAFDQFCGGDVRAAWDTLRLGAELARQLEAAPLLARFACQLAPWSEFGGGDEAFVYAILEQAICLLGQDDSDLLARLLAHRAELECDRPLSERRALLDEAEALAQSRATPEVLLQVAYSRATMRGPISPADHRESLRSFRTLDAQHRRAHADPVRLQQTFYVEWLEYFNALTVCELEAADTAAERCRSIAQGASMVMLEFLMALLNAGRQLGTGRLVELATTVERLREVSGVGGSLGAAWMAYAVLLDYERGALAIRLNNPSAQQQLLSRFAAHQRVYVEISFAWVAAQTGDAEAARRWLAAMPRVALSGLPRQRGDLGTLCMLAETYHLIGELDGAAQLLPLLEPFAALNAVGHACEYRGAVAHYLGLLSALLGRSAEAVAHFERAEELNRKLQMPLQLARTQAQRARVSG